MTEPIIPFTNNQGENDIRMTKVQQKISVFSRSLDNAQMFSRIPSYQSTCRKNDLSATKALDMSSADELPTLHVKLNRIRRSNGPRRLNSHELRS